MMDCLMRSWQCFPTLKKDLGMKIKISQADILHLDLEDSIRDHEKHKAREALQKISNLERNRPLALRINSLISSYGIEDLLFIKKNKLPIDIIILAKTETQRDIEIVGKYLFGVNPRLKLFAVIETLVGLNSIKNICENNQHLAGVIFGAADIASEMNIGLNCNSKALDFIKYEIAIAANTNNILAIDSPCFNLNSSELLKSECLRAKDIGFTGKIALHPNQVNTINNVFKYSNKEKQLAREIIDKFNISQTAALKYNGNLIGPPFVKMAKRLVERSND